MARQFFKSDLLAILFIFLLPAFLFSKRKNRTRKMKSDEMSENIYQADIAMKQKLMSFLQENEGKIFRTVRNLPFSYQLTERGLKISRVALDKNETFTYKNIEQALEQMPVAGPGAFHGIIGTSYCFSILSAFLKQNQGI